MMKCRIFLLACLLLPLVAKADNYEITVNRKKDTQKKSGAQWQVPGMRSQDFVQTWIGDIQIRNRMFTASPELVLRYLLFVKRGDAKDTPKVDKIKGTIKLTSLKAGQTVTAYTEGVPLKQTKTEMDVINSGWNGKPSVETKFSQSPEDMVIGVWIRLYAGETQVHEYLSPTSLKNNNKWED